jgi:hypothetical protein
MLLRPPSKPIANIYTTNWEAALVAFLLLGNRHRDFLHGQIGRTARESQPDFPQEVQAPQARRHPDRFVKDRLHFAIDWVKALAPQHPEWQRVFAIETK